MQTQLLPSGARSLRAYYLGDTLYSPSTSPTVTETVNPVAATPIKTSADMMMGNIVPILTFTACVLLLSTDPRAGESGPRETWYPARAVRGCLKTKIASNRLGISSDRPV